MDRTLALLKLIALCGGVFGGLLVVIVLVMLINYCRNRCAHRRPVSRKPSREQQRNSVPLVLTARLSGSVKRDSGELVISRAGSSRGSNASQALVLKSDSSLNKHSKQLRNSLEGITIESQ